MNIPPRIIQTSRDRSLSSLERAGAANLRLLHPDWEYVFFDDADIEKFVASEFPEYVQAFARFPRTIQRIDFFRYLAVYRLGGFYFDLDVLLHKPLHSLTSCACVFPFEEITFNQFLRKNCKVDWEVGNYAFGSTAAHPFLKAVIENCLRSQTDSPWAELMMQGIPRIFRPDFEVLNTTGPGLLSRTLAENPGTAVDVTILFPEDVRKEDTWHHFGDFGVHLMEGSWRSTRGLLHRKLMLAWESWTRRRAFPLSYKMGPARTLPSFVAAEGASFFR